MTETKTRAMETEAEWYWEKHEACVNNQLESMKAAVEKLMSFKPDDYKVNLDFDSWWSVEMIRYSLAETKKHVVNKGGGDE